MYGRHRLRQGSGRVSNGVSLSVVNAARCVMRLLGFGFLVREQQQASPGGMRLAGRIIEQSLGLVVGVPRARYKGNVCNVVGCRCC